MPQPRREPDIDRVRDAMRDHDEREDADREREDADRERDDAADEPETDDDDED